jgi:hypothetical protein
VTTLFNDPSAAPASLAGAPGDLSLEVVTTYCGSNTCPTVYQSDRGTFVVQGYAVDAARAGVDLPPGELLVEIPVELLANAARIVH